MFRRGKLVCSVSEEVTVLISNHLISLGVPQKEAFELSRKYENIKLALANSSLYKVEPVNPANKAAIQSHPEEEKIIQVLSAKKQLIKDKLLEIGATFEQIEILIDICETPEEAIANIIGEVPSNPNSNPFKFKTSKISQGEYNYIEKKGVQKSCNVCLMDYTPGELLKTLPCFHVFHKECIQKWFNEKKSCPICLNPN